MNSVANYGLTPAFLLAWAAKATVLLGTAWIVAFCLRGRSAALRHRVWAIAIVGSLALPLASLALPAWHVISRPPATTLAVSQTTPVMDSPALPALTVQSQPGVDMEKLIAAGLLAWSLGTVLVAFRLLTGLVRLWRISAYSTAARQNTCAALDELRASFGITRRVRLLESVSATMMPMTWGMFRPRVVLPLGAVEWDAERRRIVFSHELAHVLRNDWLFQFCGEVLCACFWFHPLAWIASRRLRQESEHACDDAVLNSGIAAPEYATQLLALAQALKAPRWRFSLALAIARPSNLERRFAAMLNSSISRRPLSRKGDFITISLGACLLLPLAALAVSAQTSTLESEASAARPSASATGQPLATGDGSISGTIVDQRGIGILGAEVNLTSSSTHTQQKTATKPDGTFLFSKLQPGLYVVNIERPGLNIYPSREISVVLHDQEKMATIRLALPGFGAAVAERSTHPSQTIPAPNAVTAQAAQSGPVGSISGSVGDPSGAMVPRASVTLTDVATGQQQHVTAGPVGDFTFSNLIPDGYELAVAQPGFQIYRQTIQIYPSEELKLPELLLTIGEISQTMSISASRIDPARAQTSPASTVPVMACSAQTTQAAHLTFKDPLQAGPPPRRIRVGGMVEAARLIENPAMPIYPDSARAAGVQGTVVLNAIIGKDGSLLSPCVVNSQIDPALVQAAIAAISQWRYSPTLLNGEPVEVVSQIGVVYSLTN